MTPSTSSVTAAGSPWTWVRLWERLRPQLVRPVAAGAAVWLFYIMFVAATLAGGHQARDFADQGSDFVKRTQSSSTIRSDPTYQYEGATGYDGQFFYYIALDPVGARPYIDVPAYRYTRILYPALARLLALGQPSLVPYALILINVAAAGAGTLALASWLRRRDLSIWWSLVYGLYPGLLIAVRYDLSEVLAFSLAAFGVLLFDATTYSGRVLGAMVFGLAVLTRESSAVIALPFLFFELTRYPGSDWPRRLRHNLLPAMLLGACIVVPYIIWRGLLYLWLRETYSALEQFDRLPFLGLIEVVLNPGVRLGPSEALREVVTPATIVLGLVLYAFWSRRGTFAFGWLLILHYVVFVMFLSHYSYIDEISSPRVTTGLVLTAVLCLPELARTRAGVRYWFVAATALWLSSLPIYVAPAGLHAVATLKHHLQFLNWG